MGEGVGFGVGLTAWLAGWVGLGLGAYVLVGMEVWV